MDKSRRIKHRQALRRIQKRNALVKQRVNLKNMGLQSQVILKMDFEKVGWWIHDCIRLAQDRNQWRTILNKIMNFETPCNTGSFQVLLKNLTSQDKMLNLTLCVPCIVTNSINKPTRCTFCMYLFYNLCTTLHVSNYHFVHHQDFINLLYLQFCTKHSNVSNCSALRLEPVRTVRPSS